MVFMKVNTPYNKSSCMDNLPRLGEKMATFKGRVHIPYMELGNMPIECLGVGRFGRFCSLRNR